MAGYQVAAIVAQLPTIAVLVAGIALLMTRRATLPARSVQLGVAGCVTTLAGALGGLAWSFAVWALVSQGGGVNIANFGLLSFLIGGILTLLHASGLGLLIAAVLGGVRATAGPMSPTAAPPT
jgi:hypothetical protein